MGFATDFFWIFIAILDAYGLGIIVGMWLERRKQKRRQTED